MNPKRGNYSGAPGSTDGRTTGGPVNDGPSNNGVVNDGPANLAPDSTRAGTPFNFPPLPQLDAGTATGGYLATAEKSAAQLANERNVASSPLTEGQRLQEGWRKNPETHPGNKFPIVPPR